MPGLFMSTDHAFKIEVLQVDKVLTTYFAPAAQHAIAFGVRVSKLGHDPYRAEVSPLLVFIEYKGLIMASLPVLLYGSFGTISAEVSADSKIVASAAVSHH